MTVSKIWDDADDQDGKRPASIRVKLLANGAEADSAELKAENEWKHTFSDLDKYAGGAEIVYTIEESEVPDGYTATVENFQITNSHTPEKTSVTVSKIWDDANNRDGTRPASVTVKLLANGTATQEGVLNAKNKWKYTFSDLDKYADGKEIVYTVEEAKVPAGYTAKVKGFEITNVLKPTPAPDTEPTPAPTVDVSGVKTWVDDDDAQGLRPQQITVHLVRDGEIVDSRDVTEADGWRYSFDGLPERDEAGRAYAYAVREDHVDGYFARTDGYNLINTRLPSREDTPPEDDKPSRQKPKYGGHTLSELMELIDLFDYGTPLFGALLGTGDETPLYPFVFGGIGLLALGLALFARKRRDY